jgi:iron-sulfur cluster assembly protein
MLAVASLAAPGGGERGGVPQKNSPAPTASVAKVDPKVERRSVVSITPAAIAKLLEVRKPEQPFVRVGVKGGGVTGFMYDMKFDNEISTEGDYVDETDGVTVVVDKKSALYLEGTTIGWRSTPEGKHGFTFENPNAIKLEP